MAVHVKTLPHRLTEGERQRLVRRARFLAWASLAWMTAEGLIAVVAGIMAGSIALIGFGIDSAIEGVASVVIIWRFWGARALSERAERRAQKLVAVQFFILAPYVAVEALRTLLTTNEPEVSWLGNWKAGAARTAAEQRLIGSIPSGRSSEAESRGKPRLSL